MTISKVLICDDNRDRVERWKATVEEHLDGGEVQVLSGAKLAALIRALDDEEQRVRDGITINPDSDRTSINQAEWADVILIDSDLSPQRADLEDIQDHDERANVALTLRHGYGDTVARQLRTYTDAKLLVVVNMFWSKHSKNRVFDLTLTQAAYAAADLTVMAKELADPQFWGASTASRDEYRPWQRTPIQLANDAYLRSVELDLNVNDSVLRTLGIDYSRLTAHQLDAFQKEPNEVTFADLTKSRLGFKYPEAGHGDDAVARMAKSAARRWIERILLPAQNVVMDAPHLFERYWRLLGVDQTNLASWDAIRDLGWDEAETGPASDALSRKLFAFLARPAFEEDKARKALASVASTTESQSFAAAFAEDVSSFYPIEELQSFPSDVSGPYSRRWVLEVDDVGYEPANRLLL